MMNMSQAQASLLSALHQLPGQRATIDDLCARAQRRKTGLKKLQDLGYVQIAGHRPVYQGEADERVVTLTAAGQNEAAGLAGQSGWQERSQQTLRTAAVAPSGSRQAPQTEREAPLATGPADAKAVASNQIEQASKTGESKLDVLARRYLGGKVKIYADAIPAAGTLTTIGTDFVHIVTNDGWDLVYDADDIEVTAVHRKTEERS